VLLGLGGWTPLIMPILADRRPTTCSLISYAQSPLHEFSHNFPIDGEVPLSSLSLSHLSSPLPSLPLEVGPLKSS